MKIQILGTKGEISESAPYHRKQSGLLIDDVLLVDLGDESFLKCNPKWILITHFHPDHAYFMRKGKETIPMTDASLFGPEPIEWLSKLKVLSKEKKLGPYQVIPIPTHHSAKVKSQAYLIKRKGVSILYTGDLVWIDKEYHSLFQGVDLIVTEASFIRKGGMIRKDPKTGQIYGHNGLPNLIHLFKEDTQTLLLMHFGSWFFKDIKASRKQIFRLAKENGIKIIVGYDGMELFF